MYHIFEDSTMKVKASALLNEVSRFKHFESFHTFNPLRDFDKECRSCKTVELVGDEYELCELNRNKRYNYLYKRTDISSEYIAGILAEILKRQGYGVFEVQWRNYINDYIKFSTAGNPYEVAKYLSAIISIKPPKLPPRDKVSSMRVVQIWKDDWTETPSYWCQPLERIKIPKPVLKEFREANDISYSTFNRLVGMNRQFTYKDAFLAMTFCISAGIHPIKFLNFAGLWMTERNGQPESYQFENPVTQQAEIELIDGDGRSLGYRNAKPTFTAGFFYNFSQLIRNIKWFDDEGNLTQMLTDDFVHMMQCLVLEYFCELNGAEWQIVTGSEQSCNDACNYYADLGMTEVPEATKKELTDKQAKKLAKKAQEQNLKSSRPVLTGNPLFDAELLSDE